MRENRDEIIVHRGHIQHLLLLQQTEIDGSCQTKVSVPVNTELYIIVPVRQKSRYSQLSLYQIRKTRFSSGPPALLEPSTNSVLLSLC